jgi:hypothetical protein
MDGRRLSPVTDRKQNFRESSRRANVWRETHYFFRITTEIDRTMMTETNPQCAYGALSMDTEATMGLLQLSQGQSKSREVGVASSSGCALPVHGPKKQGNKKPLKKQTLSVTTARALTAGEGNAGGTASTRTPQQKTTLLRALGLVEAPKYPVTGDVYRMDFLEFRQHMFNKLPLYDGRAVTTLGPFRKSRNYKFACALHPTCPFLLHGKQMIFADGLAYQEIKTVVNHTCSVQSHAHISLCSLNFLGYLLREQGQQSKISYSYSQGVDGCSQAGKKFGLDFLSMPRRQMFYKVAKTGNKQHIESALSAFRSPSPICVTQIPGCAGTRSNPLSSLECQNDSTAAELVTTSAEGTSCVSSTADPPVDITGIGSIEMSVSD